jgi:hypothetical protein
MRCGGGIPVRICGPRIPPIVRVAVNVIARIIVGIPGVIVPVVWIVIRWPII